MKGRTANIAFKILEYKLLIQAFRPATAFVSVDRNEARNHLRNLHATVMPHPKRRHERQ